MVVVLEPHANASNKIFCFWGYVLFLKLRTSKLHLFLHCPVVMDMWAMVFGLFGVSWVISQSIVGLLACWQGRFGRHRNGYIWLMVPHCLLWCLWRERNSQCLEDKERSISDLKLFFFRTLMDWLAALQNLSFLSFIDFLDACNFCSWLFDPLYTSCVLGCSAFLISINFYLSKKKNFQASIKIHVPYLNHGMTVRLKQCSVTNF